MTNNFKKCKLSEECKFSELYKISEMGDFNDIKYYIHNDVIEKLYISYQNNGIGKLLYFELPQNIEGRVFAKIIKTVEEVCLIETKYNIQLAGKIYEYFIGRDKSRMSDMGAYFTNRYITNFADSEVQEIEKIEKKNNDITFCDPFGGSGGFTLLYAKKVKNNKKLNNIYHFDMNNEVVKLAALEMFYLSGIIPNTERFNTINSFKSTFMDRKFDIIYTNPPYGGDDFAKTQQESINEKIKNFIKKELKNPKTTHDKNKLKLQLENIKKNEKSIKLNQKKQQVNLLNSSPRIIKYAEKNGICSKNDQESINDKEGVSLLLLMELLKLGGICVAVLKDGVFFNSKYKIIRKPLINNFNILKIIKIPNDQYENTQTETSIIIFKNTGKKTEEIEFSELKINRYKQDDFKCINGTIYCTKYSGDTKNLLGDIENLEKKVIRKVKYEDIVKSDFSLNYKEYNLIYDKINDNYEYISFDKVSYYNSKTKLNETYKEFKLVKIRDITNNEIIPTKGSYDIIKKKNVKESNICLHNDIIFSSCRPNKQKIVLLDKEKYNNINDICFQLTKIRVKDNYCPYILYGILKLKLDTFQKLLCTGSQYPTLKKKDFIKYKIPYPKNNKRDYWSTKIKNNFNNKEKLNEILTELNNDINNI